MSGKQTLDHLGIDYERVYPRWVQYVNEYEEGATPFEGMAQLLQTLFSQGYRLAICSSKKKKQYDIDMPKDWLKYFEVVTLEEDCKEHKPSPLPLQITLQKLNISKEEALYVGDAIGDYLCANNAGVDFMFANWMNIHIEGMNNPTYEVHHPHEVLEVLDRE